MSLDFFISQKINGLILNNVYFDTLIIFLARYLPYGLGLIATLLVFYYFFCTANKKFALTIIFSPLVASLATLFLRLLHQRQRPFYNDSVDLLFYHSESAAFPSLHSSFFFALSGAILFYNKKAGIIFFIASCFVAVSRVIAGLHWPGDVLFGMSLGIFCAVSVNFIFAKLLKD